MKMRRRRAGYLGLVATAALVGCGDSASKTAAPSKERNAATAPLDYLAVQGQAKKHSEVVASLAQVQQALQQFRTTEDRWPENLQELVRAGLLARVPSMPAGQRIDYDPRTGTVRAAR
jgi:hypothetical protein